MSERVLFISGRCPHSKKILVGIQQYEFMKSLFRIINVDTQPFPDYVKTVPCLLINGQIIKGNTVFEYLGKLVEGKKDQESRESKNELNDFFSFFINGKYLLNIICMFFKIFL